MGRRTTRTKSSEDPRHAVVSRASSRRLLRSRERREYTTAVRATANPQIDRSVALAEDSRSHHSVARCAKRFAVSPDRAPPARRQASYSELAMATQAEPSRQTCRSPYQYLQGSDLPYHNRHTTTTHALTIDAGVTSSVQLYSRVHRTQQQTCSRSDTRRKGSTRRKSTWRHARREQESKGGRERNDAGRDGNLGTPVAHSCVHLSAEALVHAFDVLGSGVAVNATAGASFPWALVPAIPYTVVT